MQCSECRSVTVTDLTRCWCQTGTPDLSALIQVKPGLPDGTQFVFQREGNQTPATEPGPVVFVLRSEKHPRFSRRGADLLHTATIPLNEALTGTSLPVLMLDGRCS